MSVARPKGSCVFGAVTPAQGDIKAINVHLGASKEINSFTVTLDNYGDKYGPVGDNPIVEDSVATVNLGREPNSPLLITGFVESVEFPDEPNDNECIVFGRCNGRGVFDKQISEVYVSQKGEAIIKDVLDQCGISHTRAAVELVENCDTTYGLLEYDGTPAWDIIKYISETSDLSGVIGYAFRIAPDGKAEWFAKGTKAATIELNENFKMGRYKRSVERKKDKIKVYGKAARPEPTTKDYCEGVGDWTLIQGTSIDDEFTYVKVGTKSVRATTALVGAVRIVEFERSCLNMTPFTYKLLKAWFYVAAAYDPFKIRLLCPDASNYFEETVTTGPGYNDREFALGKNAEYDAVENPQGIWTKVGNPQWSKLSKVRFYWEFSGAGNLWFIVDGVWFADGRFRGEAGAGTREFSETDEELISDAECVRRAEALLDRLDGVAENFVLTSETIDYGLTPLLGADNALVVLPNEGINSNYEVVAVDYDFDAEEDNITLTAECGREPPQLADYLYGLRSTTVTVEKLSRTKRGMGDDHINYISDGAVTTPKMAPGSVTADILATAAVIAGKIAAGAVNALDILVNGLFSVASGRVKFESAFINEALIENLAVTNAKIANLAVDEGKIANLAVTNAKIGNLAVTNAKINDLDAGKINAGYLAAARLDVAVAYISQTAMIANLVVTTAKLAESLGIKSSELPVLDPTEYTAYHIRDPGIGGAWTGWMDIGRIWFFNAYSTIKHELTKAQVDVRCYKSGTYTPDSAEVQVRCWYSTNGSSWTQFGSTYSDTTMDGYATAIFTGSVLTSLNVPFYVKLDCRIWNGGDATHATEVDIAIKNFELTERAFRGARQDI